jgi:hypothetical protein
MHCVASESDSGARLAWRIVGTRVRFQRESPAYTAAWLMTVHRITRSLAHDRTQDYTAAWLMTVHRITRSLAHDRTQDYTQPGS